MILYLTIRSMGLFRSDVRNDSNISLQINEIHTIKDRVRLIVCPISMLAGSENVSVGERLSVSNLAINWNLIYVSGRDTKPLTAKLVLLNQEAVSRAR
jgi:hypothetical protein